MAALESDSISAPGVWNGSSFQIALCLFIGAIYSVSIFGWSFFAQDTYFWSSVGGDLALSVSAGRYYLQDPWSFPLFHTPSLGTPAGTVIVFADAIPLFALIAKVISSAFGVTIPYHAVWFATCYTLQGVAAGLAVRAAGVRDTVPVVTACILALAMPTFLFRFQHVSLNGHFLLLLAIALYFVIVRSDSTKPSRPLPEIGFVCLFLAAILVQPYLAAMVGALLVAALVQAAIGGHMTIKRTGLMGLALVLVSVFVMALTGHMFSGYIPSEGAGFGGFGTFSMNLASPLVPQLSGVFPPLPDNLDNLFPAPNRYGGIIDATGGQYEGYNYLGAGLLALLAIGLFTGPRHTARALRRHWVLSGVCLCLLVFALSNRAFLMDLLLYEIPLDESVRQPFEQFRSSGRFFWPVAYCLLIGAVMVVWRCLSVRVATAVLLAAAALQVFDTRPLRATIGQLVEQSGDPDAAFSRWIWDPILSRHDQVVVMPPIDCRSSSLAGACQILASHQTIPINSAWTSGRTNRVCADAQTDAATLTSPPEGALVIFIAEHLPPDWVANTQKDPSLCRRIPEGTACSQDSSVTWVPGDYFTPLIVEPSAGNSVE